MEIGSEFWEAGPLSPHKNTIFPDNCRYFMSGRTALSHIIEDIQARCAFRRVLLPSYCCETMIKPFLLHGIAVRFYPVRAQVGQGIRQEMIAAQDCQAILLMDYFGFSPDTDHIYDQNLITIWDITHSVFTNPIPHADYIYGSMRKWTGLWTGGFAWRSHGQFVIPAPNRHAAEYVTLRKEAMGEKKRYIEGQSESKQYLQIFQSAAQIMEDAGDLCAEEQDIWYMNHLDVPQLKKARRDNAEILMQYISSSAIFPKLRRDDCPLFVPILLPNRLRGNLRAHLIEQQIYCPIHWPMSSVHLLEPDTEQLYLQEMSLVCDQRYSEEKMHRMGSVIADFLKQKL